MSLKIVANLISVKRVISSVTFISTTRYEFQHASVWL